MNYKGYTITDSGDPLAPYAVLRPDGTTAGIDETKALARETVRSDIREQRYMKGTK